MRISSPPFLHPCYYGTDIDSREHLIACHHSACFDGEYPTAIPTDTRKDRFEQKLSERKRG